MPRSTGRDGRSARLPYVLRRVGRRRRVALRDPRRSRPKRRIADIGLSEIFVGLIVVPIIGNAAEHSSAILMAMKNRMDLAVNIAVGSSAQVALLIAPVLVFVGLAIGQPMDLAFSTFEVIAVALAVAIGASVVRDAESHWLEGAFLLLVYGMLGVAFYFY